MENLIASYAAASSRVTTPNLAGRRVDLPDERLVIFFFFSSFSSFFFSEFRSYARTRESRIDRTRSFLFSRFPFLPPSRKRAMRKFDFSTPRGLTATVDPAVTRSKNRKRNVNRMKRFNPFNLGTGRCIASTAACQRVSKVHGSSRPGR